MKYLVRAIKYFFYFAILTTLIILALIFTGLAESDVEQLFRGGTDSIWKIAVFFIAVAAIYPKVGFINKSVPAKGNWNDNRDTITSYMNEHSFVLESENDNEITFRHSRPLNRLTRMLEDRITLTFNADGFEMEGLRKDVFRLATGLEYRLNPRQDD